MPEFDHVQPPYWNDRPIIIIGCGPSLKDHDLTRLKGLGHVIAVKGMMFDIDWADVGFGIDLPRLREWLDRFSTVPFPVWWAVPEDKNVDRISANLHLLRRMRDTNLGDMTDTIFCGGTSGLGALVFAWLKLGPVKTGGRIYLFGYDHQPANGEWHYNPRHYWMRRVQRSNTWGQWASRFDMIAGKFKAAGVEVVNASPDSLVTVFPRISFDEAVEELTKANARSAVA